MDSGRVAHVLWRTIIWPLDVSRELFMGGQSFSRHTVSGSLAVHYPYCGHDLLLEKVPALIKVAFLFHFINWLPCFVLWSDYTQTLITHERIRLNKTFVLRTHDDPFSRRHVVDYCSLWKERPHNKFWSFKIVLFLIEMVFCSFVKSSNVVGDLGRDSFILGLCEIEHTLYCMCV